MQIKGIGKVKAIQLKAICELAIRLSKPNISKGTEVKIQIKLPKQFYVNFSMKKMKWQDYFC